MTTAKALSSLEHYDQVLASFSNDGEEEEGNRNNITRKGNLQIIPFEEGPHDEIAICNLAVVLPFREGVDGDFLTSYFEYAASIALAVEHLNTGNPSIVRDLRGLPDRCNIRFTLEWFDTSFTELHAVDEVIRATDRPLAPCAFLGAMRSAVSMPTSIITSLRGYPQISAFSTSADLNDPQNYPLFGRTIPSDDGISVPIILHLKSIGVRYLGVVYVNDAYGTAFARGLQAAAEVYAPEMAVKSVDIGAQDYSEESIQRAVKFLKDTAYRYMFFIPSTLSNFRAIMTEAHKQGIAGTGKHTWLFSDAAYGDVALRTFPKDSTMHKALLGTGVIQASGGLPEHMPALKNYQDDLKELRNLDDIEYLLRRSPYPEVHNGTDILDGVYLTSPNMYMPFLYDSAISAGLGACNAAINTHEDYFDGKTHFEAIKSTTFIGPSGAVSLDSVSGSRDPASAYSALVNFLLDPSHDGADGTVKFVGVVSGLFSNGEWQRLVPYEYADGSNIAPRDIGYPEVEENFIGTGWRVSGYVMCGLGIAIALVFALWTYSKRDARVFRASQPFFLYIICFGVILMLSSIIPLGVDGEIASSEGCTIACTSFLWLLAVGFSVTFSALYTKTRRVNKIMNNPGFKRIKVTPVDVAKPMIVILGANFLILILMTILSPIVWKEEVITEDQFDQPTETRGYCYWNGSLAFVAPLAAINFACLLFAVAEAYHSRSISIEFAESEYIFKCLLVVCLAFFFAFPVLLILKDNNVASFFFLSAVIFVTCCAVLMLIFIPKIWFDRKQAKSPKDDHVRISMGMSRPLHIWSSTHSSSYNVSYDSSPVEGLRVLSHPKTEDMLKARVEKLERQLRELTNLHSPNQQSSAIKIEQPIEELPDEMADADDSVEPATVSSSVEHPDTDEAAVPDTS